MTPEAQHDALSRFATTCHEVLEANMHKGGWDRCDPNSLFAHLLEEVAEVAHELQLRGTGEYSPAAVQKECADIANMAMMVSEQSCRIDQFGDPLEKC